MIDMDIPDTRQSRRTLYIAMALSGPGSALDGGVRDPKHIIDHIEIVLSLQEELEKKEKA